MTLPTARAKWSEKHWELVYAQFHAGGQEDTTNITFSGIKQILALQNGLPIAIDTNHK